MQLIMNIFAHSIKSTRYGDVATGNCFQNLRVDFNNSGNNIGELYQSVFNYELFSKT